MAREYPTGSEALVYAAEDCIGLLSGRRAVMGHSISRRHEGLQASHATALAARPTLALVNR